MWDARLGLRLGGLAEFVTGDPCDMNLLHKLLILLALVKLTEINGVPRRLSITFASLSKVFCKTICHISVEDFSLPTRLNLQPTIHTKVVGAHGQIPGERDSLVVWRLGHLTFAVIEMIWLIFG